VSEVCPLVFEDVAVRMGARDVIADVSLEVRPGEILSLAGPNGAGKTTLLRVASGVRRVDAGRVMASGQPIESLSRRALARHVAVVPQDVAIPFPFRASEVVLMGRTPHVRGVGMDAPEDVARALEAMETVGVAHLAGRSMLELSGGERQLVLCARALAQDPQVLLLDEPTAHLDLRHRIELATRVRAFVSTGRSALVVSHDLDLAARASDRLALLADGRVVATGAPADVLTPDTLRRTYGIEAQVASGPDGAPVVVPKGMHGGVGSPKS
jgi:iron complex transport system ATP-binding protein